jgi:hypothetical protein
MLTVAREYKLRVAAALGYEGARLRVGLRLSSV